MPAYSTLATPFWWMLQQNQEHVDARSAEPLPPDDEAPFRSAWVFGRARQEAIGELFFGRLTAGSSLVVFYTKSGHPLGESINRLVVGIGRLDKIGPMLRYDVEQGRSYPLWERSIEHSIRPSGTDGFLVPYHDYLEPTGDPDEDRRRGTRARESPSCPSRRTSPPTATRASSPARTSHCRPASGAGASSDWFVPTASHWDRGPSGRTGSTPRSPASGATAGAFPGLGAALEALGLRLGTAMTYDLVTAGKLRPDDEPWPLVDAILRGSAPPPRQEYEADLAATRRTWAALGDERRALLQLLSRFALTPQQARRWFDPKERARAVRGTVDDAGVLANPYRIAETDLGDEQDHPVSVGTLDRGVLPDDTVAAKHPLPAPSRVDSPHDWRRIRAGLVSVLRRAADDGDALLSRNEAVERVGQLDLAHAVSVPPDWVSGNRVELAEEIDLLDVSCEGESDVPSLQLVEHRQMEDRLRSILRKRAAKPLRSLGVAWADLLREAIAERSPAAADRTDDRYEAALREQADALERITTRRLSVLVGQAGTGKTTVLSALLKAKSLVDDGVLFLAPTGKASVQIAAKASGAEVRTVAAFLYSLGRYDGRRQRPLLTGTGPTPRPGPSSSTRARCSRWSSSERCSPPWISRTFSA